MELAVPLCFRYLLSCSVEDFAPITTGTTPDPSGLPTRGPKCDLQPPTDVPQAACTDPHLGPCSPLLPYRVAQTMLLLFLLLPPYIYSS